MSINRSHLFLLGGLAVVGLGLGCREASQPTTAPEPVVTFKPSFLTSSPPPLRSGYLTVCKDTPGGTTGTFQIDAWIYFPDGSTHSVGTYLRAGECTTLVTSLPDPTIKVFENLGNGDPGWHVASVSVITDAGRVELSGPNIGTVVNPAECSIDFTHGCIIIFHNEQNNTPPPPPETTPCPAGSFTYSMNVNGDLVMRYDQFPAPNDNSYGVNAVGWGSKGHTFGNLVGSDHAGFQLVDGGGTVRLSFNVDYLTAQSSAPSGYASLGVTGGDGGMLVGTSDGISATTSLANNLNNINIPGLFSPSHQQQFGSVNVLQDSPPTDPQHATYNNSDPALAGWDFHNTYFVTISAAKLAAIGFNPATWRVEPNEDQLHNSPAKACPTGAEGSCALSVVKVEVKDRQVLVTVRNDGSSDRFLTDIVLNWPSGVNGKLKKVKRDGDVLYDSPDIAGGSAHLGLADLPSDQNRRKWRRGESNVLTFEFERNADKTLSHYSGTVSFENCLLALFQ